MSRKRQKNQLELAFTEGTRGEAPATDERAELLIAKQEPESGGTSERLMGEICEPENMMKALKRVQGNKGAPGIDGMKVDELPGYLKKNGPKHREEAEAEGEQGEERSGGPMEAEVSRIQLYEREGAAAENSAEGAKTL